MLMFAETLTAICDSFESTIDKTGRVLSELFLTLPAKKAYPDYFKVIKEPIALDTIRARVESNSYTTIDECLADFNLMFDNAQQYNAPRSQVWIDAKALRFVVIGLW